MAIETCTLGGGCFWCIDSALRRVEGVVSVASGYAAGETVNPTYEQVCTGTTGHAEVVQITFDSEVISYKDILEMFFSLHDPTTLNRQGADVGTQYRSIILYHTQEQKREAENVIAAMNRFRIFSDPVVTQIEPLGEFYEAEGYHQDYYESNQRNRYCQVVITPKLAKFSGKYARRLRR
ncbi:MAG: peptide-methionine (S)-S-oxide reductase MsrA [Porticoccaceae bacterium]